MRIINTLSVPARIHKPVSKPTQDNNKHNHKHERDTTKRIYNCLISRLPQHKLKFIVIPHPNPDQKIDSKVVPKVVPVINKVDLRSRFQPVYDQGSLGSCTANALCAAYSFNEPTFTGSRLFLYYNERLLEKTISCDCGAYLHDGIKALETYGVCSEAIWPYNVKKFAVKPTEESYKEALKDKVLTAQNINPTLSKMKNALTQGYPFVFGFIVFDSFQRLSVSTTGIVPMPEPREKRLGGHAVIAVGYDDTRKMFIFRNSWGTGWGDKGYGYIPYAYLTNSSLTSDLWYITAQSS